MLFGATTFLYTQKYPSLAEEASLFYDLAKLKNETGYHFRLCTNGCHQLIGSIKELI
jgi:hypothetical protein